MELWQLWLLFVVPKMAGFVALVSLILVILGTLILIVVGVIRSVTSREDELKEMSNVIKFLFPIYIVAVILLTVSSLVPTKKEAMLIVGGYYALNIEGVADLPPNVVKATNKFIEEYLNTE